MIANERTPTMPAPFNFNQTLEAGQAKQAIVFGVGTRVSGVATADATATLTFDAEMPNDNGPESGPALQLVAVVELPGGLKNIDLPIVEWPDGAVGGRLTVQNTSAGENNVIIDVKVLSAQELIERKQREADEQAKAKQENLDKLNDAEAEARKPKAPDATEPEA